jgi:hypothetical protein
VDEQRIVTPQVFSFLFECFLEELAMVTCPACGKDNDSGTLECGFCGIVYKKWTKHVNKKKAMGLAPDEVLSFESDSNPQRKRVIIGVGLGLILLVGGVLIRKFSTDTLGPNETGFPVLFDSQWGYINAKGKRVILPQYDAAEIFSEGLAAVLVGNEWGYINRKGEEIVPPRYGRAGEFSEGFALARLISGYWEIINTRGEVVGTTGLDPIGKKGAVIATFHDGRALMENLNGQKVFINTSGTIVGSLFDEAFPFSEGLALVQKPGLKVWSFVGPDGSPFFPYTFLRAESFSEGLAPVEKVEGRNDPGMGFIDKSGDYVLRPQYKEARSFHYGLSWVITPDGTCASVDRVGRIVFQVDCAEERGNFKERLAWILKKPENKYGVLDLEGTLILRPAFSTPPSFRGGVAFVSIYDKKYGAAGYVNKWGNYIWKISHDKVKTYLKTEKEGERKLKASPVGQELFIGAKKVYPK